MASISHFISIMLNLLGKEQAYLDPGSGSFIIQLIIAGLVGAGFLLRGYLSKIVGFFRRGNPEQGEEGEDDLDSEP